MRKILLKIIFIVFLSLNFLALYLAGTNPEVSAQSACGAIGQRCCAVPSEASKECSSNIAECSQGTCVANSSCAGDQCDSSSSSSSSSSIKTCAGQPCSSSSSSTNGGGSDGGGGGSGTGGSAQGVDACNDFEDEENKAPCVNCINTGGVWTAVGCLQVTPVGIITNIIRIAFGVVSGVALVQLIIVGLMYQSGNEQKIAEARSKLFATLGGTAVLVFSVLIMEIIGVNVLDVVPAGFFVGG